VFNNGGSMKIHTLNKIKENEKLVCQCGNGVVKHIKTAPDGYFVWCICGWMYRLTITGKYYSQGG